MDEAEQTTQKKSRNEVLSSVVYILEVISIISTVLFYCINDLTYVDPSHYFSIRKILEIGASALVVFICLYYLIKRIHYNRISALFCTFFAASLIWYYVTLMTYGNFFYFTTSFIVLLLSTLMIAFSIDLFRGLRESAVVLKPLVLITAVFVLFLNVIDFTIYHQYYPGFTILLRGLCILQLIIGALAFASLFRDNVLKGYRLRMSQLPRIPILASIMVLYGLIYLLDIQPVLAASNSIFDTLANVLLVLVGLIFLLYRNVDVLTATSIMLFAIGLSTIIKSVPELFSTDGMTMVLGLVSLLAGAVCILLCALMYSGDKFNTKRLQVIMLILLIVTVVPIILDARLHPDPGPLVDSESNRFLTAVLLAGSFIALTDKSIKYSSLKERMSFNVHTMNDTACNDADAYISRIELFKLYIEDGWSHPEGPVEKEKTVRTFINGDHYQFTVRKWRDDGKYTAEVHSSNEGTYIQVLRFDICQVVMDGTIDDCTKLTIYGEKGFFITVPVMDEEVDFDAKKIHKIYFKIIGHKNKKVVKVSFSEFSEELNQSVSQLKP